MIRSDEETPHLCFLRRLFCAVLSVCLLLACSGLIALADEVNRPIPIDPSDYYGRTALATLRNGDSLVFAYDQLAEGVESSDEEISLNSKKHEISIDELDVVLNAYLCDYPHHFWLSKKYSYSYRSDTVIDFYPSYTFTGTDLVNAKKAFNSAVNSIMADISVDMSLLEREEYLHDVIAKRTSYISTDNAHNAYGALVEGEAVCEGYAEAFQYLLYRAGILNVVVTGTSKAPGSSTAIGHAWNLVELDGDYYYVDLTWDDQSTRTFHEYFNITTDLLLEDHVLDTLAYDYPVCTATKANYFYSHGGLVESFSVDDVVNAFNTCGSTAEFFLIDNSYEFWSAFSENYSAILEMMDFIDTPSFVCYILGHERLVQYAGHRYGDVTGDSVIDQADVDALSSHLDGSLLFSDEWSFKAADMNKDAAVNSLDYKLLYKNVTGEELTNDSNASEDDNNTNTDDNTTAEGDNNTDTDDNTTAEGDNNTDTDDNTTVEGDNNTDTDDNTTAEDDNNTDTDDNTTAEGDNNTDTDDNTTAEGDNGITEDDGVSDAPTIEIIMGDLDGNQILNAADALAVLKNAVGKTSFTPLQIQVADLNDDDAINAADALIILRIAVGKE